MVISDPIQTLGLSESMARLLRYLALRPSSRPGMRELQRELGVGSASIQRELSRLVSLEVLRRLEEGHRVRYQVVDSSPLWGALLRLVEKGTSAETMLGEALRGVAGLEAAFIFGSTAAGTARPDSDVDLFVVADELDTRAFHRAVHEAGLLLGREVNPIKYSREALASRLASGTRFIRDALTGPKRWVAGDPRAIAPIAIAAGVPFQAAARL